MADAYQIKNQEGTYYLTFQVVGWADIFSRKCYRDIIIGSLDFCRKHKGLKLYAYVVMTNHVHVIVSSNKGDLSGTIRDFKKYTSKEFKMMNEINESRREWLEMIFQYHAKQNKRSGDRQLWTHENHAIELTDNVMINGRIDYIHQNPVRAGWVAEAENYLYSSAMNFANLDHLLQIDEI
ncbi:MAG: transposase [Flavobacteriales bacterium]|nr:transposase [Flavobacteriales bacterium]